MSFANHNILDIALSIIPPTVVQIRKNLGTAVNKFGQSQAAYSEWLEVYGIVQPGGEQNEHVEGMDFSKKHVTIWLRGVALDGTHIQWAPDQIRYVGMIFNVVGVEDWYPYDNYRKCECVEAVNLDASQRAVKGNAHVSSRKTTAHRKTKQNILADNSQQMLPLDQKPNSTPPATALPKRPTIFTSDQLPQTPIVPPPPPSKGTPNIGKGKIKF